MSTRIDGRVWVAAGQSGVVGAIQSTDDGFAFRLSGENLRPQRFPTLEVAKSALTAALGPGASRPEFSEH